MKKTIVVAMSGGVDSSVVATMLNKEGHNVIGITLQLHDYGNQVKPGTCCAGIDIYDAKRVADKIGIPHYVFNYESKFKKHVIDDFVDGYIRGETPLPCVRCNQSVKFNDLLKVAKELGADALATGHYIRKIIKNNKAELHKGISKEKDQSYFLFATTQEQLEYLMFPLGSYAKDQTRQLASEFNLDVAQKPDSQDICFVPNGNYRDVVANMRPESIKAGRFIHVDGYDLGMHKGVINYTIGQRRGIGISHKTPLYVIKIDAEQNIVYLGTSSDLIQTRILLKEMNWLVHDENWKRLEISAKIRSTTPAIPAKIVKYSSNNTEMEIKLLKDEKAISPGQACVLYHGSRLLGGGWIRCSLK